LRDISEIEDTAGSGLALISSSDPRWFKVIAYQISTFTHLSGKFLRSLGWGALSGINVDFPSTSEIREYHPDSLWIPKEKMLESSLAAAGNSSWPIFASPPSLIHAKVRTLMIVYCPEENQAWMNETSRWRGSENVEIRLLSDAELLGDLEPEDSLEKYQMAALALVAYAKTESSSFEAVQCFQPSWKIRRGGLLPTPPSGKILVAQPGFHISSLLDEQELAEFRIARDLSLSSWWAASKAALDAFAFPPNEDSFQEISLRPNGFMFAE
jgi:hypothetical protein